MKKNSNKRIALVALLASIASAATADPQRLDIPAGNLLAALEALAKQANVDLIYQDAQVKELRTEGVRGELSPYDAVIKLLHGTPLEVRKDEASGAILIRLPLASQTMSSATARSDRVRLAQATGSADDTARGPNVQVEEIVVTAQKRAERIQDVPLSISAITADEIDQRGLFGAADYLRGVPGTNQVEGGPFGQAIVIRGIETSPVSQNFNSGTTTATYFGETPTTNSAGLAGNSNVDIKLVDIERVEVLRGPQGTAFGSSSLGGAVRIIPVAPDPASFEAKVAVGYSSTSGADGDNYNMHAIANAPLIADKAALRVVGYKYHDSGFYTNRAGSNAAFQAASVIPNGVQAFARDQDGIGAQEVVGGRIAALFQATDDLRFTVSHLWQRAEVDGVAIANSGTFEQTLLQVAPEQVRRGQAGGFNDTEIQLSNIVAEYSFSWADLLATYSYTESEAQNAFAFGYLGLPQPQSGDARSKHRENVGEIRFASKLDGPLNFLAGVYYEELEDGVGDDTFQTFYWLGNPTATLPRGLIGEFSDRRSHEQHAFFGEISWELLPQWTLTGGARIYDYERTRHVGNSGPYLGGTSTWVNSVDADGTNFRGNLSYQPNENVLLYAGWSQGFRLGTPTGPGLSRTACDVNGDDLVDGTSSTIASTGRLNSDEVDSYEIGTKLSLLDRRVTVDAAVFRMEWTGMPVTLTAPAPPVGCGLNYQANAGSAISEGVELQVSYRISDPIRVDLGGSWIDATLTDDVPGVPGSKGNRLAGAPEVNANLGLQYSFDLGAFPASVRADSVYVGSFFGNVRESPNTEVDAYVKLDASARLEIRNLIIDLFVRNLTDEDSFTFRRNSSSTSEFYGNRMRPRTIGLQLGYTF